MAKVYIPPTMRSLTDGKEVVEVDGGTVRAVIDNLEARYPGIRDRLCEGDELKSGLAVAIGSSLSTMGLYERVEPDSEIHFLPAISGGQDIR